jgi:hypothetical protein
MASGTLVFTNSAASPNSSTTNSGSTTPRTPCARS